MQIFEAKPELSLIITNSAHSAHHCAVSLVIPAICMASPAYCGLPVVLSRLEGPNTYYPEPTLGLDSIFGISSLGAKIKKYKQE